MPIEVLNIDGLKIRNLRLGVTSSGKFTLNFSCLHASSYVLCFGSSGLLGYTDALQLRLNEEDLRVLSAGNTLQKENVVTGEVYRLQGVTKAMMGSSTAFQNFRVTPPEQIQVWSMLFNPVTGTHTLYVPAEPDSASYCFVPLRYDVVLKTVPNGKELCVILGEAESIKYRDGSLTYSVDGSLPIPIPTNCINKSFTVPCSSQSKIIIKVAPAYIGKYEQIRK